MIITGFICVALTAGTSTSTFSPWNRLRILPRPPRTMFSMTAYGE